MKTQVISFWGGPGSGKSTTAALAFAKLKQLGYNAELVREYVKDWAWEGRKIGPFDQWLFLGEQSRRETMLFGKVSHIVTDSPFLMGAMYAEKYSGHELITDAAAALYRYINDNANVAYQHVLLKRTKPFNPAGRYENEEQARAFDAHAMDLLERLDVPYRHVTAEEFLEGLK